MTTKRRKMREEKRKKTSSKADVNSDLQAGIWFSLKMLSFLLVLKFELRPVNPDTKFKMVRGRTITIRAAP